MTARIQMRAARKRVGSALRLLVSPFLAYPIQTTEAQGAKLLHGLAATYANPDQWRKRASGVRRGILVGGWLNAHAEEGSTQPHLS